MQVYAYHLLLYKYSLEVRIVPNKCYEQNCWCNFISNQDFASGSLKHCLLWFLFRCTADYFVHLLC